MRLLDRLCDWHRGRRYKAYWTPNGHDGYSEHDGRTISGRSDLTEPDPIVWFSAFVAYQSAFHTRMGHIGPKNRRTMWLSEALQRGIEGCSRCVRLDLPGLWDDNPLVRQPWNRGEPDYQPAQTVLTHDDGQRVALPPVNVDELRRLEL